MCLVLNYEVKSMQIDTWIYGDQFEIGTTSLFGVEYIQIVDADRTPTRYGIVKLGTGVLCVNIKAAFDNCGWPNGSPVNKV